MSQETEQEKNLKKELFSAFLQLLARLVGETVKDKLLRTVFIGLIGMAGYYFDLPSTNVTIEHAPPPVVTPVAPIAP